MRPCIGCGKTPTCYHAACSTVYCVDCINGILDAVHGMSPECVAACVAAVRAFAELQKSQKKARYFDSPTWSEALDKSRRAHGAAIALLPKEGT